MLAALAVFVFALQRCLLGADAPRKNHTTLCSGSWRSLPQSHLLGYLTRRAGWPGKSEVLGMALGATFARGGCASTKFSTLVLDPWVCVRGVAIRQWA